MTPDERQRAEAVAERALRRGEVAQAIAQLEAILAVSPSDAALAARVAQLRESAAPQELDRAATYTPGLSPLPGAGPTAQAEAAAARGDFATAIALYRALLVTQPNAVLFRERLEELFRLVEAQAPRRPAISREAALTELLDRVSARRRNV